MLNSNSVSALFPWIFQRATLTLDESGLLVGEASILAFRKVDFLPVLNGANITGTVTGREIIQLIVGVRERGFKFLLERRAVDIMRKGNGELVGPKDKLPSLLALMSKIRLGDVCVVEDGHLRASVSLPDIVRFASSLHIKTGLKVDSLANTAITLPQSTTISVLLDQMLSNGVRRIVVSGAGPLRIVDDRVVAQYALSEEGLAALKNDSVGFFERPLADLSPLEPGIVKAGDDISDAWKATLVSPAGCAVLEDKILTPWDLVIRVYDTGNFPAAREDFENVVMMSFVSTVRAILGETASEALFLRLRTAFDFRTNEVYAKRNELPSMLAQVLGGVAGPVLLRSFVRELYSNLGISAKPPSSFEEAIRHAKGHLQVL